MTFEDGIYKFGIGQFESLEELLDHFTCLPVLGTETGNVLKVIHQHGICIENCVLSHNVDLKTILLKFSTAR